MEKNAPLIISFLNDREFKTKKELIAVSGLSDREVRKQVSEARQQGIPVISHSEANGFRLPKNLEEINKDEIIIEINELEHTKNELIKRADELYQRAESCDDYLKNARQCLEEI